MNRKIAKAKSLASETSIGDLRKMIEGARRPGLRSRVNQAFTMEQVCDIYLAALAGRDDAEIPAGLRDDPYSSVGRKRPTGDSLIIMNILRDCAL